MASFIKVIDEGLRTKLYTKFKTIQSFTNIKDHVLFYPKEIALRKMAERRERTEMEFINFWRVYTKRDVSRQRTPLARSGLNLAFTDDTSESGGSSGGSSNENTGILTTKAVPVTLGYYVWHWSRKKEVLNEVIEEYMFWPFNDPNLTLQYNDTYPVKFDLHFDEEIVDEGTVPDQFQIGEYFVRRAAIEIDGWIFTNVNVGTVKTIVITVWDRDEIDDVEEFIVDPEDDLQLFTDEYDLTE